MPQPQLNAPGNSFTKSFLSFYVSLSFFLFFLFSLSVFLALSLSLSFFFPFLSFFLFLSLSLSFLFPFLSFREGRCDVIKESSTSERTTMTTILASQCKVGANDLLWKPKEGKWPITPTTYGNFTHQCAPILICTKDRRSEGSLQQFYHGDHNYCRFLAIPLMTSCMWLLPYPFKCLLIWILGSGSNRNCQNPSMHHGEMGKFVASGQNSFCVFAISSSVHFIQKMFTIHSLPWPEGNKNAKRILTTSHKTGHFSMMHWWILTISVGTAS